MCATLHVLWSLVYIGCGAIQLVVGIFFLIAKFGTDVHFLRLGSNVVAGGWDVVVGVTGALVACVGPMSSPGRHEALLYLAVSVLAVNAVNLAVLEVVEWKMLMNEANREAAEKQRDLLFYARLSTSAAAAVAMVVSFLDSQLTFCTLQHTARKRLMRRRSAKGHSHHHGHHGHHHGGHHHDHSADSEYIILPRVRPSTKGGYEQYTRSWVFDVDGNNSAGGARDGRDGGSARYQQLDSHSHADKCRDAAAAAVAAAEGRSASSRSSTRGHSDTYTVADAKAIRAAIANGGPPPDSPASAISGSGPSGSKQFNRQQKHKELMREREHQKQVREQQQFQQRQGHGHQRHARPGSTASTASAASSAGPGASPATRPHQPHQPHSAPPAIAESPASGTSPDSPAVDSAESRSRSPEAGEREPAEQEGVGYHSLMSELTQVIRKKPSPKDDTSSADFNRQLEAALQDIHDLDSSTGGTLVNATSSAASSSAPPPPAPDWGDSDEESSASSRTGKRRSQPRLGRAFAIPVPPPVPPPHADSVASLAGTLRGTQRGSGTLRATLRTTQTGTLTGTLRRQWRDQQQQGDQRTSTSSPEPPELPPPSPSPPPPPPPTAPAEPPQSPVRSKTVVTICDGDMVVRELNNNGIVLVPAVPAGPATPAAPAEHELPAPVVLQHARSPLQSRTPSPTGPPAPESPDPDVDSGVDDALASPVGCSMGSVGRLGGLSLLRKAKQRSRSNRGSACAVRLSQELQGAVLQSESLVFLSDSELVARHERNRRVQREIEQRVQQQISGHSGSDSLC